MGKTTTNTIKQNKLIRHRYDNYALCVCALFFALIFARGFNDLFFFAFAGVSSIIFIVSNAAHCISFLFFLLPFSTILKHSVNGISFFTVLFFLLILKMTISLKKVNLGLFVSVAVFSFYSLVVSGFSEITTIVTMASGLLLLYYLRNEKLDIDVNTTIILYSAGICLSSALALLKHRWPIIDSFISESIMKIKDTEYATRFSGLQGNPNYYTLDIIVALSAIVILMYNNKATKVHSLFFVALSILGLMSVSKSFLLTWGLLMIFWMLISIKQGFRKIVKFFVIIAAGAIIAYCYAYDYINTFVYRLTKDFSGTFNSITTGRSEIWLGYIEEILQSVKTLFVGKGLNTMSEVIAMGTHNTYLELIYGLGLFGAIILLVTLRISMGKIKLSHGIWIAVIILMVRMFALGMLTYDNLWFYLATIIMLARGIAQNNFTESTMLGERI